MTRKTVAELKTKAREELLYRMASAFDHIQDRWEREAFQKEGYTDADLEALRQVMSNEMARVEHLFDYVKFSFTRGC
jgi:uncharacterized caspase-like protein